MGYTAPPLLGSASPFFLTPASDNFGAISQNIRAVTGSGFSSAAWSSANDPVAMPFWIAETITVFQLGWVNGSGTMTDSCDVGIYTTAWARLVSAANGGAYIARSGASTLQMVDTADTVLTPGKYHLVMANTGTTAGQQMFWTGPVNAVAWSLLGLLDSSTDALAGGNGMPDPLTNMAGALTATRVPVAVMACRTLV